MKRKVDRQNDTDENDEKKSRYTTSDALIQLGVSKKSSSSLLESPNMLLLGHLSSVTSLSFDQSGDLLASGSRDNGIFLWNIKNGCSNDFLLKGHVNAITDVNWLSNGNDTQSTKIISSSADKTLSVWDAETGLRIQLLKNASSKVINAISPIKNRINEFASVGDDGLLKIWDIRSKRVSLSLEVTHPSFPLLSVSSALNSFDLFVAGTEGIIRSIDMRKQSLTEGVLSLSVASSVVPEIRTRTTMTKNNNESMSPLLFQKLSTITSVSVSSDSTKLLSFATDGTLRSWDIKPFCSGGETRRQVAIYEGSINNFELLPLKTSWWNSHDTTSSEDLVSCGSADGIVRIWNAETAKIEAAFGGHIGPVLSVSFHPKEKLIASSGFDKQIFLSDINNGLIVE